MNLRLTIYSYDFRPIDASCTCPACSRGISRAWLHAALGARQSNAASYVTLHNLTYLLQMMRDLRASIISQQFPEFVQEFFHRRCKAATAETDCSEDEKKCIDAEYEFSTPPQWCVDALQNVNISIKC